VETTTKSNQMITNGLVNS